MGRVTHFEIHAAEPERAMGFYRACFGWRFERFGDQGYWWIKTGPDSEHGIDGGLMPRRGTIDGEAVIAYVCTLDVDDLDVSSAAILEHGGTPAVPKMPIPGVGWLAYFKDTEGNIFGIMQADEAAS